MNDDVKQAIDEALPDIVSMIKSNQYDMYGIFMKKTLRTQDVARIREIIEESVSQQSVYDLANDNGWPLKTALLYHLSCESIPCWSGFRRIVEYPPWLALGISRERYTTDYNCAEEYEDYDDDDVEACGIENDDN